MLALMLIGCAAHSDAGRETLEAQLDHIAAEALQRGPYASITLQVRKAGETAYAKSFGYADLELAVPATPEHRYAIGSLTKTLTAYTILRLVEQGRISLHDRLSILLPDYKGAGGSATLLQILTHTAGIPDLVGDSGPNLVSDPSKDYTREDVVALFERQPADFAPGQGWQYSNSGYYLLGLIIERITGQTYQEAVRQLLVTPWSLHSAALDLREPLMKGRVRGYTLAPDRTFRNAASYDGVLPLAGGGYRVNAADLLSYVEGIFDPRKTSKRLRELMFEPATLADGTPLAYRPIALVASDFSGHRKFAHGGMIWGFATHLSYFPDDQVAIALLTNTDAAAVSTYNLDHKISRVVLGLPARQVKDVPLPESLARRYVGTYLMRETLLNGNQLVFRAEAAHLTFSIEGSSRVAPKSPVRLLYQGAGEFTSSEDDEVTIFFEESGDTVSFARGDYFYAARRVVN